MPSLLHALVLALASPAAAGTLAVPVSHGAPLRPALTRRDGAIDVAVINNATAGGYFADFGVGSPPQTLAFQLDTGSSDTWVNSADSDLCAGDEKQATLPVWCQRPFKPDASSTFKDVRRGGFNISYLDGRTMAGDYFDDSFTVAGRTVTNQRLGLALTSVLPTGIIGLGFSANVAANVTYPTVVDNMVSQGLIDRHVFSLYLNNFAAKSGTILFGGIDSQKYYGKLTTLPLVVNTLSRSRDITSYAVRLEGFQVDGVRLPRLDATAILDSGSTISLVPGTYADAVHARFGVRTIPGIKPPFIDCAYRKGKAKGTAFSFQFDGLTIKIPMDEMVIDSFPSHEQAYFQNSELGYLFSGWDGICIFGIGSTEKFGINSDSFALLGDTFLRSAYVVYDMGNSQVGIAKAKANSDKSNIVELHKGAKDLPDVAGLPDENNKAASLGLPSIGVAAAGTLIVAAAALIPAL